MPTIATDRQLTILHTVRDLTREHEGIPPTIAEVAERAAVPRSSTYRYVHTLCELGLLVQHASASSGVTRIMALDRYREYD